MQVTHESKSDLNICDCIMHGDKYGDNMWELHARVQIFPIYIIVVRHESMRWEFVETITNINNFYVNRSSIFVENKMPISKSNS